MLHKFTSLIARCMIGNRSSDRLRISHQNKYYRELKKKQWLPLEENRKQQKEALYSMVCYAIREVPYYQDLSFTEQDFSVDSIYEDLRKLPLMTKEIMREQGKRLYSEHPGKDWSYENTSGGTTGEPVRFLQSGKSFDYDQAGKLLFDEWAGRLPGDRQIRLWGSERDIISGKKDWMNKIYRWCRNEVFLNTFKMSDAAMRRYVSVINRQKPKMILAYVQSARELARYVERERLDIWSPKGLMTSAGTLDSDTYELLSRVFRCPILNRYGSREVGDMACSCEKKEGLHINMANVYLEVIDRDGNPCSEEEVGEIVVTSLTNKAMPLIRYRIGDRGAMGRERCTCGRGWVMLKSVNGRIIDFFKTEEGNLVYGDYFTHLFYGSHEVKQFQVVQDRLDHILVKLVFLDGKAPGEEFYKDKIEAIQKAMGEKVMVDFKTVDDIPVSQSGKRSYTISLVQ